jgi:Dolichyl-phosphate-mannose-protein mannosyltransferase
VYPPTVAPPPGPSTQPSRAPLPRPASLQEPTRSPQSDGPAKDRTARYVALFAAGISVAATAYFYHRGQLILYDDEFSRMSISRRIFDNPSGFSFAQLGGVWLPWPQLEMMPFVALRSLYFDGLGGSIPSMLSFVACSALIYKIVYRLAGRRRAPAIAAAAVFMLNPNVLYMQSTALSELGMFLWLLGGVYGVQRFFEVEHPSARRRYIALAGISCTLALLTRYEGWIVTAALLACVLLGCARRGDTGAQVRAWALSFAFFPFLALLGWLAYNQVIFGSALYFYDGPYAKPSLWSSATDPAVGNWLVSTKTYLYAILDDTNWPTVALGLAGILALAVKRRLASHTLPALSLLLLIPFFIWSLHGAQRPMHVEQINHSLYNTRFALVYAPTAAIYIGCLIGALRRSPAIRIASVAAVAAAVAAMGLAFASPDTRVTTLEDNFAWSRQPVATQFASAAAYLRAHYHHGLVLAQFFGSEGVLYEAHITPGADVYEGIHQLWLPAIANPVRAGISWVVMRTDPIDLVYRNLHDSRQLLEGYRLVYDRSEYQIYERRGCGVGGC